MRHAQGEMHSQGEVLGEIVWRKRGANNLVGRSSAYRRKQGRRRKLIQQRRKPNGSMERPKCNERR